MTTILIILGVIFLFVLFLFGINAELKEQYGEDHASNKCKYDKTKMCPVADNLRIDGPGILNVKSKRIAERCEFEKHIESGLSVNGTSSKSRVENQKEAFTKLARQVIEWYRQQDKIKEEKSEEVIRNYHGVRNEVHDKASGLKQPYKKVVEKGDIGDMVEARRKVKGVKRSYGT